MSWNYRLITHKDERQGYGWIGLHEVYYEDGKPSAYTSDAIGFRGDIEDGPEGVIEALEMALRDAKKAPPLDESDFPEEDGCE